MEQPRNGLGTRKDLVLYRIQTSKDTLKSAEILFAAGEYKGANNRSYYAIFHASDYDDFYITSREETERQIEVAVEFIQMAETYCMSRLENT